jgi:flagellin-specific chaperone FliS
VPSYQLIILLWDKVWKLLRNKKTAMQTTNIIDNNENKTRSRKTKTLQLNFYNF